MLLISIRFDTQRYDYELKPQMKLDTI